MSLCEQYCGQSTSVHFMKMAQIIKRTDFNPTKSDLFLLHPKNNYIPHDHPDYQINPSTDN